MKAITWGLWYWPWFLIATSVGFLVPETIAFVTNAGNTLSDYSWDELGISQTHWHHNLAWGASLTAWLTFTVVITAHIWFKVLR